jgi:hypothetical protein
MGKRSKIEASEYKEVVDRLIASGWSSGSITLYMGTRYQFNIDDSTVRRYKQKNIKQIELDYPDLIAEGKLEELQKTRIDKDEFVDTVGTLGTVINMQMERIQGDIKLEKQFGKLMPTTKHELRLLTDMVRQYNEIMQDYGIVPKVGETLEVKNVGEINQGMTKPILESLSPEQVNDVFSFAKTVHEALPVEVDTA